MRRLTSVVVGGCLAVLALAGAASASWTADASGSATVGADTMSHATSFASSCVSGGIKLTWVLSTATTYTDKFTTVKGSTYSYTIAARAQSWTTAESTPTSRSYSSKGACA